MSIKGWKHPDHLDLTNSQIPPKTHPRTAALLAVMKGTREGYETKSAVQIGPKRTHARFSNGMKGGK